MDYKNKENLNLLNPKKFQEPIVVDDFTKEFLFDCLNKMLIIRLSENKLAQKKEKGEIIGPVHLSAGQEAIAVGISKNLSHKDKIFGAHRSHSHLLAVNQNPYKLFAEVLGRKTGFSKGMGGSMHLIDKESGFFGSVPIVSGTVPLAVGAAYQSYKEDKGSLAAVFLGDGAIEEGVVHESLNLSKILPAPCFFVVENNLFSSHMHISLRQPDFFVSRFADANFIKNKLIDGNDIVEVFKVSRDLLKHSRHKGEPSFLEAITFRHYGHVDWRKDVDVGVNRSQEDIEDWMQRDPIKRLASGMIRSGVLSEKEYIELERSLSSFIDSEWEKAKKDPQPDEKSILDNVYYEN